MDLEAGIAIVTGAAGGLGEVLAHGLADLGAHVLVADLDPDGAGRVSSAITAGGGRSTPIGADVSEPAGVEAVVALAESLGGPRLVVNNAGGWGSSGRQFPEANIAEWSAVLRLNLAAPMMLTQRCRESMQRGGGGLLINIASSAGRGTGAYGSPEYGAAKAGLIRFSTALADWRDRYNIRVNCIVPDWIGLDRARAELAALPAAERDLVPPLIPPQSILDAVYRFVTDDDLTGRVLVMDGGQEPRFEPPS